MIPRQFSLARSWRPLPVLFLGLCAILCCAAPRAGAIVDLNSDQISDVWALFHPAEAQTPTADRDGDGFTNAQEAAAGTDPASPGSIVRISSMSLTGGTVRIAFPTLSGKRYQLQSRPTLSDGVWTNLGSAIPGTGSEATATSAASGAATKFYRVLVQDADSDGDQVSDWEELALGYDPNDARTNGIYGDDDFTAITKALAAVNTVAIHATEPSASEVGPKAGVLTFTRSGNLNAVTVRYTVGGSAVSGSDYQPLPATVVIPVGSDSVTVPVLPVADSKIESAEAVSVTLTADAAYSIGQPATATVLISDHAEANGTGVRARYWNNTSATVPAFANTNVTPNTAVPRVDRIESQINNIWGAASPAPGLVNADYFVTRYTADVLPQFSQVYTFEAEVIRGGRLYVDGKLIFSQWGNSPTAGTFSGTIELQAGRRYPIVFEHMTRSGDATAILRWASANLPEEVIPQNRLFPTAPPQILSPLEMLVIKGGPPVSYQIVASGDPTSFSAANLPPGWSVDAGTGLITGSPSAAGLWDVAITATNGDGSGSAILRINVISTGGGLTRETWPGAVNFDEQLPAPASTGVVSSLEGPENAADNYSSRLRGFLTAPATGVYKFWLTGSNAAELWISNDEEVVNAFKRASVAAATGVREWSSPAAGKSPLLWLEAGRRYFVEVRHRAGVGEDHVSVGWLQPGQGGADPDNAAAPGEVVPGYALSPFTPPAQPIGESTLYSTSLTAQGGASTSGYGTSVLRLSADETVASVSFNYANLSSPVSGKHVHSAAHGGLIIFDLDEAIPDANGAYTWEIGPVSPLSREEVLAVVKGGDAYINIHTANYPAGEIKGFYRLQSASQTFTPPAPAPAWTSNHAEANAAARFLVQSTYGVSGQDADADGTPDSIAEVQTRGFEGWIDNQFGTPATLHYPNVYALRNLTSPDSTTYSGSLAFNTWWKTAVTAPDQLRQRVAFALSQIMVVSEAGVLDDRGDAVSDYYDTLVTHSFGNFRDLIEAVTLHPAMGRYLDMLKNDKPDRRTGRIPNENYAREILQLFSVGLNRVWPDGSLVLNSKGQPVPTYDQEEIIGFAHAFTGWDYNHATPRTSFGAASNWIDSMREVPPRHFTGQKRLLNNVVLPGLPVVAGQPLDPFATHSAAQYNDPAYQALPAKELDDTHDQIFHHPNTGPFICRQLIQRLVTSTPSRGYIYRVVQKFNDNGAGVRGDMKAVIKAILLDYEARSPAVMTQHGYGKQREPVLRVTAVARAFANGAPGAGTYSQVGNLINVTVSPVQPFANGVNVFLDFAGGSGGDPDDAPYSISNVSHNAGANTTTFTVRPLSTENTATYSQAGATLTVTVPNEHSFNTTTNNSVYLSFTSGAPSAPADGVFTVTSVTSDEIRFTTPAPDASLATYAQTGNTVTLTVPGGHPFAAGATVHIDFVGVTPAAAGLPASGAYQVLTATSTDITIANNADAVTRTGSAHIIAAGDIVTRSGDVVASRSSYAVNRSGTVKLNYSDWGVDSTDTDLNQTPLKAPTVFNFFEPDYSFPGVISQAGLITPEFQLTSDTAVMRQANFLYSGIFNDLHGTPGLSSFRSGNRDLVLDFRPWMGNGPGNVPWTNDVNLSALIDKLNTLLLAGQLPSTGSNNYTSTPRSIENAKLVIQDYVRNTANIAYSSTNPTPQQRRDRLRAIIHLLVTSADFTIQK